MILKPFLLSFWLLLGLNSCCKHTGEEVAASNNDMEITSKVVNASFVGNGVQWGGYDMLESWTGNATLSVDDWDKLFERVRFMRPPLVRIMVSEGWNYLIDGQYNPAKSEAILVKILNFCQTEGIDVLFGEWGHTGGSAIDTGWLEKSATFLECLINTKGFSCIRYFNMVNEPNGSWSSINGNYSLWENLIEQFHSKLVAKGIDSKIKIIGPDVAVWDTGLTAWISNATADLGEKIGACDIHTYPNETEVRDGSYQKMTATYRLAAPASKEMLMTELGFKYATGSTLGVQNGQRIAADKYSSDDCNLFVYDAFYAIDIADAMIQNMLAGYAGNILWDLDDAMYNVGGYGSTKLKRWGFWNILGAEKFENAADENIRPWFYTASLMCRYFPKGTVIYAVNLPDKFGLRAIAGKYNGKYTIAIVNSHKVAYTVNLKMENGAMMENSKIYQYKAGEGANYTAKTDADGLALPETSATINFSGNVSKELSVPAQSFCLITNME
jgi:hypothetical protein